MFDLSHRLLSRSEEYRLIRSAQGVPRESWNGLREVETLIRCNLRLILREALRQSRYSAVEVTDLVQEGAIGVMRAIERFEPERGYRFSTYAMPWVRQVMNRLREDNKSTIRLPVHRQHAIARLARARQEFAYRGVRNPSVSELAEMLGWTELAVMETEDISALGARLTNTHSLDANLGELFGNDSESREKLMDTVSSDEPPVEETLVGGVAHEKLKEALGYLEEMEREILLKRYGFAAEAQTLNSIAREWGCSAERIRKLQRSAEKKLKCMLSEEVIYSPALPKVPALADGLAGVWAEEHERAEGHADERTLYSQPALWPVPQCPEQAELYDGFDGSRVSGSGFSENPFDEMESICSEEPFAQDEGLEFEAEAV